MALPFQASTITAVRPPQTWAQPALQAPRRCSNSLQNGLDRIGIPFGTPVVGMRQNAMVRASKRQASREVSVPKSTSSFKATESERRINM